MNPPERWRVELTRPAERDIRRLDRPVRERILTGLDGLIGDPPAGDIKRLAGITPRQWRLRVGDRRVRFSRDPESQTILVLGVLPRSRVYRESPTARSGEGIKEGIKLSTTAIPADPQNPYEIRGSTRRRFPEPGGGPRGRRFKSCLPTNGIAAKRQNPHWGVWSGSRLG